MVECALLWDTSKIGNEIEDWAGLKLLMGDTDNCTLIRLCPDCYISGKLKDELANC